MFGFNKKENFSSSLIKDPAHWEWMVNQNPYTPDICQVEKAPYRLVFLGDDMKRNRENFSLLEGTSEILSSAVTDDSFNFLIKAADGTPFALDPNQEEEFLLPSLQKFAPPLRILGELHRVPNSIIMKLDNHRQNGVQFHRVRKRLTVFYRDDKRSSYSDKTAKVTAYMYVAAPSYWAPLINDGTSIRCVPIIKPRTYTQGLPEYYTYPKNGMLPDLTRRVKRR